MPLIAMCYHAVPGLQAQEALLHAQAVAVGTPMAMKKADRQRQIRAWQKVARSMSQVEGPPPISQMRPDIRRAALENLGIRVKTIPVKREPPP